LAIRDREWFTRAEIEKVEVNANDR
jgi:hypothetical protein